MSHDPHSPWTRPDDPDSERTIAFEVPDTTPDAERTLAFDPVDPTPESERTRVIPTIPPPVHQASEPRVGPVRVPPPVAAADPGPTDPRGTVDWALQVSRLNNRPSTDVGLLVLRLLSLPLVLHGAANAMNFVGLVDAMQAHPWGALAPELFGGLVVAGQLGLPVLLAVGFGTRLAALAQALVMAGVWVLAVLPDGPLLDPQARTLASEVPLAYAALALPLLFTGPGRVSLDHAVTASSRERRVEKRVTKRLSR